MRCAHYTLNLAFRHPFTIAKGTKTHQPTFVVSLEHLGITGYGEAPAIAYYNIPVEKMAADLDQKKQFVERFAFTEPERYWHYLHHLFPNNPFLVCALDMAAWDLFGKIKKQPLYKLWNVDMQAAPVTDYTIGIDTPEKMVEKMQERPWPVYKIKMGMPGDLDTVTSIRKHTHSRLRVDVNGGWHLEEALQKIPVLHQLGIEFVEQPLPKDDWQGMKALFEKSPLPLVADESCVSENDVAKCTGHFHGINIKLTKCSGITPARRMIADARSKSMRIMLGCMNETSLGTAAIAHLAPLVDYLDADGPLLLQEDIATGLTYREGKLFLSAEAGLGVQVQLPGRT